MKTYLSVLFTSLLISCSSNEGKSDLTNSHPLIPLDSIMQNMLSFDKYLGEVLLPDITNENIIAYDSAGHRVTTEQFLDQFGSGNYLPLKLETDQKDSSVYQLLAVESVDNQHVLQWLQFTGGQYATFYGLKHKALPNFHFVDLNGREYNNTNLNDKLVILKFWFIGCKPCIEEMPELNKLVDQYKDREDVIFLSLANDGPEELRSFLSKTSFDYAVVADKASYTMDTLGIRIFPTHMIVKNGKVEEVMSYVNQLESSLKKEVNQL